MPYIHHLKSVVLRQGQIIDKLIAVEWDLCERIMIANKPPLTDDEKRQIDEAWNVAEEFTDD